MYLDCKVKIPSEGGKITIKTISGTPYVYYETGRQYLKDKHYNTPSTFHKSYTKCYLPLAGQYI